MSVEAPTVTVQIQARRIGRPGSPACSPQPTRIIIITQYPTAAIAKRQLYAAWPITRPTPVISRNSIFQLPEIRIVRNMARFLI
jgi:hypothetical protein